jgi:hypothetical protein
MIDKLAVLGKQIKGRYRQLAVTKGFPGSHYDRVLDLRSVDERLRLPARLFWKGKHNGIHKVEMVDVAKLGWTRTRRVLEELFGDWRGLKIYRIDCCVDIPELSVWYFLRNCRVSRAQNFQLIKSRHGVSVYLQMSAQKTIVIYDRVGKMRAYKDPQLAVFKSSKLTRIEVQLKGAGVPYQKLAQLPRYAQCDLLSSLQFFTLHIPDDRPPAEGFTALGLRTTIRKYGQVAASKMVPAQNWASLRKTYFKAASGATVLGLTSRMQKSVRDWLDDRIRFPRSG